MKVHTSMGLNTITFSRINTLSALSPTVDRYVRETYDELLKLPVPKRFYDLLNSYEQKRESYDSNNGNLKHGTALQAQPESVDC